MPLHQPLAPWKGLLLGLILAGLQHAGAAAEPMPWTVEALREDLDQLQREFLDRDRAYAPAARAEAMARLAKLRERTEPLDPVAFALAVAQLAALADNGHTLAGAGPRVESANRVPLRLVPFGDDFHVVRAREPHQRLLGARLLAIDDVPLPRLREAARALAGGPPAWRDRSAPLLFESPQQLHALGLLKQPDTARYRFATPDGQMVEAMLEGEPPGPDRPRADTVRLLLPEVLPEQNGWHGALPASRAPWWLQQAGQRGRWRMDTALQALVVELRTSTDTPTERLRDTFDAVRQAARDHAPRHLVLDLRQNGGGDLTRVRDFAESLPALVPGRLFVLTSPWTFSAAISTAGYLKQAAPQRVTIVGEPVGDRLVFFAEGRFQRLRHSGQVLLPATERHDYVDGCRRFSDCHAPVVQRPIAVPTLEPDLPAPLGFADWHDGVDPAMRAVAQALALAPGR